MTKKEDIKFEIVIPVSVQRVKKKCIKEVVLSSGTLNAVKEIEIHSKVEGYYNLMKNPMTKQYYVMGDSVRKDDVIINIKNDLLEKQLKIDLKRVTYELSEGEYNRQKALFNTKLTTEKDLKTAEEAYIEAKYDYEIAQLQRGYFYIMAPFKGTIVELPYFSNGVEIKQNDYLLKVADYSSLYLNANIFVNEMNRIKNNQMVRVFNQTISEDTLLGTIKQISPAINPENNTFNVLILVNNPNRKFRPGMFIKAEIVVSEKEDTIVIPKDLLVSNENGYVVFVIQNDIAQERLITTGLENFREIEVISGLEENELLVTKGFETLRNNSKVEILNDKFN